MEATQGKIAGACQRLVAAFEAAVPTQLPLVPGKRRPSEKEIATATEAGLQRFYAVARSERDRLHLGILGRARVALGLQRRLLAAGYPAPLVKQVLFALLTAAFTGR